MPLTWNRRATRQKEIKQSELKEQQDKIISVSNTKEEAIAKLNAGLEEQDFIIEKAGVDLAAAEAEINRAISGGKAPFGGHTSRKANAEAVINEASIKQEALQTEITTKKEELPEIPEVPDLSGIPLEIREYVAITFFSLIDLFKIKAWVAALIVASGVGAWYLVTTYNVLEKLGL